MQRLKANFGRRPATDAIAAQIDGKLLSRIGEEEPFGVFEVAARGCFEAEEIRLRALGRGGRGLGSLRLESDYPSCDN